MRFSSIQRIRSRLDLSRSELARFLGVSEATVVRWERDRAVSEPRGLQAVLLSILEDATSTHDPKTVARVVRSCGLDHRDALKVLLEYSQSSTSNKGIADEGRR